MSVTSAGEGNLAAKQLGSEAASRSVYPSKSSLIEGRLMLQEVAHDNNFNLTETVYSQFTTHHSLKKAAFTLAEVLITLGIIGVVAAITLPTLIKNYQKQVWVNQLKKEVSVLQNAVRTIIATEGVETLSDTSFSERTKSSQEGYTCYKRHLEKLNLKIVGQNKHYDYCAQSSCVIKLYYLADGASVGVLFAGDEYSGGFCYRDSEERVMFFVDVNGDKGPNKSNRDQFTFDLDKYGQIIPSGDLVGIDDDTFAELDNMCKEDPDACQTFFGTTNITKDHINKWLLDNMSSKCSDTHTAEKVCTDLIIQSGWKMNY